MLFRPLFAHVNSVYSCEMLMPYWRDSLDANDYGLLCAFPVAEFGVEFKVVELHSAVPIRKKSSRLAALSCTPSASPPPGSSDQSEDAPW